MNADEEERSLRENEEIEYPKQTKNNIENNNTIFNLVCYNE